MQPLTEPRPTSRFQKLWRHRDVRLGALATVGNGSARLGNIVGVLIASRLLGAEAFGRFALAQAALVALVAVLGLGSPVVAQVLAPREDVDAWSAYLCRRVLVIITGGAILTELAALALLTLAGDPHGATHETARLLSYSAWTLIPTTLLPVQQALLSVALRRGRYTVSLAVQGMGSVLLLPIGAVVGGVSGALFAYGLAAGAACFVSRPRPRQAGTKLEFDGWVSSLWRVSGAAYAATALWSLSLWVSQLFLSRQGGNVEVARFAVGLRFFTLVSFVPSSAATFVIPMLRNRRYSAGVATARRYANRLLFVTFGLATVVAAATAGLAVVVLPVLGDDFSAGSGVVYTLCFAGVFSALNTVIGQVFLADRVVRHWFISDVLLAAVLVCLTALLVRSLGALGLALSYCGAYVATCAYLIGVRIRSLPEEGL